MYDGSPCPSARAYRVSTTAALRRSRDKTDLVILVLCGETDASSGQPSPVGDDRLLADLARLGIDDRIAEHARRRGPRSSASATAR